METVVPADVDLTRIPEPDSPPEYPAGPRNDLLLAALKVALRDPADHRLYQTGKLPGLFSSRHGIPADAARFALREVLLEVVRTENRGKQVVEWVRPTPKAVRYVEEHDSPKTVLQDLQTVLGDTRAGVPLWLHSTQSELLALKLSFEARAQELLAHLEALTQRVEAALRRVEVNPSGVEESVARVMPWAMAALKYLDSRLFTGVNGDCPLAELFRAIRDDFPQLTLSDFHNGIQRLHDLRAIRLTVGESLDPEYGLVVGAVVCSAARR